MARRVIILCVLFVLAAVAPASAQVQRPVDVLRVESAMGELGKQKHGAEGELERSAARRHGRAWCLPLEGQRLDSDSRCA